MHLYVKESTQIGSNCNFWPFLPPLIKCHMIKQPHIERSLLLFHATVRYFLVNDTEGKGVWEKNNKAWHFHTRKLDEIAVFFPVAMIDYVVYCALWISQQVLLEWVASFLTKCVYGISLAKPVLRKLRSKCKLGQLNFTSSD